MSIIKRWLGGAKAITHEVNGETLTFSPLPLKHWFRLKMLAAPVAGAIARWFADKSKDQGTLNRHVFDPEGRATGSETLVEAINSDMAQFRISRNAEAYELVGDLLLNQDMARLLAETIMRSLPQEFHTIDTTTVDEFLEALDPASFLQLLEGVGRANASTLRPFWEKIVRRAKDAAADAAETTKPKPDTQSQPSSTTAPSGSTWKALSPEYVSEEAST